MGDEGSMSGTTDQAAFRLATFLVTAARDLVDEPAIYGPFRMVDAVDRLMAGVFDDDFHQPVDGVDHAKGTVDGRLVDEPAIYGPFRMVDAVDRLKEGVFDDDLSRSTRS